MDTDPARAAADVLGHPVAAALPPDGAGVVVAASVVDDPPRSRVAWVLPEAREIIARVACPPGVVSRWRGVVATEVTLDVPGRTADRVVVARCHEGVAAVRVILGSDVPGPVVEVPAGGIALARVPPTVPVDAVDALDATGEAVSRLERAGLGLLRTDGTTISGRLGSGHGMGAGIGHGHWVEDLAAAGFEAGYDPVMPTWVPDGLAAGRPRIEPDLAYPAAPPAVIVAWTGEDGGRVLLRQTVAPLATPDPRGPLSAEVDIRGARGVLRGRGLVTVVWQTPERAFGVQVRGIPDGEEVALRVARSVPG